jgi:hypothetical protein
MAVAMKTNVFWEVMSCRQIEFNDVSERPTPPSLGLKRKRSKQTATKCFAEYSSETSVNFYQTARSHISENITLRNKSTLKMEIL